VLPHLPQKMPLASKVIFLLCKSKSITHLESKAKAKKSLFEQYNLYLFPNVCTTEHNFFQSKKYVWVHTFKDDTYLLQTRFGRYKKERRHYTDLIEEYFWVFLDRVDILSSALQSVPWRLEIFFLSECVSKF
jgi:hypothetical protein